MSDTNRNNDLIDFTELDNNIKTLRKKVRELTKIIIKEYHPNLSRDESEMIFKMVDDQKHDELLALLEKL